MTGGSCKTSFEITGSFDCEELVKLIGIIPFRGWNKGDSRRDGGKYEFSRLSFCLCEEYDVYISNMMEKTIAPLLPKTELLVKLRESYGLDYSLSVTPHISYEVYGDGKYSTVTPCLSPSMAVMKFCVAVGAELDIDYYVNK